MSIPPLVCSTPPPPDQCEDDKDPEDFELQYDLSQDDDDDNYDYGSFSSYNHFQSAKETKKADVLSSSVITSLGSNIKQENKDNTSPECMSVDSSRNKFEDDVIEDLDLIIDGNVLSADPIVDSLESDLKEVSTSDVREEIDIPSGAVIGDIEQDGGSHCQLPLDDISVESSPSTDNIVAVTSFEIDKPSINALDIPIAVETSEENNETQENPYVEELKTEPEFELSTEEPVKDLETQNDVVFSDTIPKPPKTIEDSLSDFNNFESQQVTQDDDFGDFDDFQFTSTTEKGHVIESCENPWDNSAPASDDFGDFGNFKASFESTNVAGPIIHEESVVSKSDLQTQANVPDDDGNTENIPDDDGFGDFEDFQSSVKEAGSSEIIDTDEDFVLGPVLSLKSLENECELMETINSFINTVYDEEIPEPTEKFEGTLESQLGVTWAQIKEVDERQPYMVNWNSSFAQKTLLKALCIDSRNILFGPKWSYNMPKYAATLSAAPLQPKKQAQPSTSQSDPEPEKPPSKPVCTWSDPFTADGQESCSAEGGRDTKVTQPGPIFDAPPKPDKIFSSTLNVQPIRQISLPDTHIFTPTNSETPHSKTIHYDSSPAVILPQSIIESKVSSDGFSQLSTSAMADEESEDYWEFQDFRGPSTSAANIDQSQPAIEKTETHLKPSTSYGTQLLKPIKIEPTLPTLNWPDPGEVKETFEDFSDFISNSSLSNQAQELPSTSAVRDDTAFGTTDTSRNTSTVVGSEVIESKPVSANLDDDFDTFQSALPSNSSDFPTLGNDKTIDGHPQISQQEAPKLDFAFPVAETSITNASITEDSFARNPIVNPANRFGSKTTDLTPKVSTPPPPIPPINTTILQPVPASSNTVQPNHQKSGQILQPLSLEGISQINWPDPGIDLQDLSRFNPVDTVHTLKNDLGANSNSKGASPVHSKKNIGSSQKNIGSSQSVDDDWGEFVSSAPKQPPGPRKPQNLVDEDEWTDFISSPSVKPQNGLNTISLNVHTNIQKTNATRITKKTNQLPLEIPSLSIITPKSTNHKPHNNRHFENL